MKRLVTRLVLFAVTIPPLYLALHGLLYEAHHHLRTKNDPDAVYVIGDSRTYSALDITALRERTGRPFYSYAQHAMSAYSVLKMAEMVPPKATVLFGPSWGMLVRDKEDASYRSGFSWRGLQILFDGDGEYWHFRRIFVINRNPLEAPFFRETPYAIEETDEPKLGNLEEVTGFYGKAKPPSDSTKTALVRAAIDTLLERGCRLEVLIVPVPQRVAELRSEAYGSIVEALGLTPGEQVRIHTDWPLVDPFGKNVWMDADHMNGRGRKIMTELLVSRVFREN